MKFFTLIQHYLAIVGIDAYHANQRRLLNIRSVAVLIGLALSLISDMVYLIYKAEGVLEHTESLYIVSTVIGIAMAYIIILCEMPRLFMFINDFEIIVNESKRLSNVYLSTNINILFWRFWWLFIVGLVCNPTSKIIYSQTTQKIEKCIEISRIILVVLTPIGFALPTLIIGLLSYFTTQLGENAFVLPYPTW